MTVPQTMQDQFLSDNQKLLDAANQYNVEAGELQTAQDNYKNIILKKLDACQTADQILVFLQMYVFQNSLPPSSPHADDCLFGIYGDQVGLQGQALQVNSYLTAVHNDLQKMANSTGSDGSYSDEEVVGNVAKDLDSILDELNGKNGSLLPGAMDPTSLSNMLQTDTTLRDQFYVYGDTSGYNPTPIDPSNPDAPGNTYHFVVNGPNPTNDTFYLTSFTEMQQDMNAQGDAKGATEAYKSLTDNFNSDTGMTQTVNSVINEKINQLTNFIKTLMGFYENGLLQPSMKLSNVSIQNQTRGS
jgi:hypothetical protein